MAEAIAVQHPTGRSQRQVFGWLLLIAIFCLAQEGLRYPFVVILQLLLPRAAWLGREMPAVPLVEAALALLLVFWLPGAFGLRLGNHRKVWWIYVACGVTYGAYVLFGSSLVPAQLCAGFRRPSAYLLTPFREELLFRGFMYGVLAHMYPSSEASRKWISGPVLFTAMLFGLWHVGGIAVLGWAWGLAYVAFTFFAGLVMGYVRRRSGSVLGPFVMHAVGNFIVGL